MSMTAATLEFMFLSQGMHDVLPDDWLVVLWNNQIEAITNAAAQYNLSKATTPRCKKKWSSQTGGV